MTALVLFATAFVVRVVVGSVFAGPAYPDSYYYVHVAQQLAAGEGFTVDFLWNLDDAGAGAATGVLPVAANALWMPLAEIVQVPFIWLLGPTELASALPFWLLGSLAAPLTYWIARDAGLKLRPAAAAGMLAAIPAGLAPFVSQPDNFALFMVLGPAALWLCARGARGDRRAFLVGGVVVGLATLSRADGVLLGLPFAVVFARELLRGRERVVGWAAALGCAALFAIVLSPWLYRQLVTFETLVPGSGRMLWLTDYQQLFSFANPPSMETWLGQGAGWILASRLGGLISALGLITLLPLAAVLAPFAALGMWVRRSDPAFAPFLVYAFSLFAVMTVLFAVVVPHGTFIHAAAALLPHTFVLVIVGIGAAVAWVGRRRSSWDVPAATAFFTTAAVGIAILGAALQTVKTTDQWRDARSTQQALADALSGVPADERFMAADPGAINYLTGRQGIVTPADGLPVIETALRAYDVRWLLLERGSIVPALEPVLAGSVRPHWLSPPVAIVPAAAAPIATAGAQTPAPPMGAVYAVCLSESDTRCAR